MKPLSNIFFQSVLFAFFLNVNILNVYSQSANANSKLYVCISDLGPASKSFVAANNIQNIPVLYSRSLDPTNALKLDVQTFTTAIAKTIPDASADGYAVIDWEGKIGSNLDVMPPGSPEYESALSEFTKALQLAKKLRPNMKWGFFGIPYPPLDKRDTRKNNSLTSLLQMEDVLCPQMYIPYNPDGSNGRRSPADKKQWVSDNLLKSLIIARKLNKQVLPFIWHRFWSDGSKQNNLQLIPLSEFNEYVKEMLTLNYNGKKIDGLILWGADSYYYSIKSKPIMDELNASNARDFDSYRDSLTNKYIQEIYNTTKKVN